MRNLYKVFRELIPEPVLQIGVVTHTASGIALVELPDGAVIKARGDAEIGQTVFVRNSVIEGIAPSLPVVPIEL